MSRRTRTNDSRRLLYFFCPFLSFFHLSHCQKDKKVQQTIFGEQQKMFQNEKECFTPGKVAHSRIEAASTFTRRLEPHHQLVMCKLYIREQLEPHRQRVTYSLCTSWDIYQSDTLCSQTAIVKQELLCDFTNSLKSNGYLSYIGVAHSYSLRKNTNLDIKNIR